MIYQIFLPTANVFHSEAEAGEQFRKANMYVEN